MFSWRRKAGERKAKADPSVRRADLVMTSKPLGRLRLARRGLVTVMTTKRRKRCHVAPETDFPYSPITMSDPKNGGAVPQRSWTLQAAGLLEMSESVVLVVIGVALVLVAVLLLYSSVFDLNEALRHGAGEIESKAVGILNTVLLVMMTMEIVYTVAITLKSHTLKAEPFLIIGVIAGIWRMLVITATSTAVEHPEEFHNLLLELGLLAATVVALAGAIWILRYSAHSYAKGRENEVDVEAD